MGLGLTPLIDSIQRGFQHGIEQSFSNLVSPRISSAFNSASRNLFAPNQAVQNGPTSDETPHVDTLAIEPRGNTLAIGPEPPIQVPSEAPAVNRSVTFALAPAPAPEYPRLDFGELKVVQLKVQCEMRGLVKKGRKQDLIDRLDAYHDRLEDGSM